MVGRRIAELRADKDLTQQRFADLLHVTVDYVRLVERGANLTLSSLERFAEALDVPVTDLLVAPRTLRTAPGRPRTARAPSLQPNVRPKRKR